MVTAITWEAILRMLIPMCMVICIGGAILLFLRSDGSRSRRLLASVMLAWGLAYGCRMVRLLLGSGYLHTDLLTPFILVGGNLFVIVLLLYPLEVLRPGWLNLKRAFLLALPYLAVVALYYIVLRILGRSPVRLHSWDDFLSHIGQFDVWFRLILTFSIVAYVALLLYIVYRYELSYRRWCDANYASSEQMEISWLRHYGTGVILIGIAFFFEVFNGSTLCYVAHNAVVQVFFCFTFYKGLFHQSPYMEDFFRHTMNEEEAEKEADEAEMAAREELAARAGLATQAEQAFQAKLAVQGGLAPQAGPTAVSARPETARMELPDENTFQSRLPLYKSEIQRWMEKERPYLRRDFKLNDVYEVLPLNRSYLSRIFNEGWGSSFSSVVSNYRIRHAEELLRDRPELTVNNIAILCGFTSDSTFHRTFAQMHDGMTPKKYRESCNSMK